MSASVKRLLVDALESVVAPVPLAYGEPARDLEAEHAWLGDIQGPVRLLAFKAANARIGREHDLTVQLHIRITGRGDSAEVADTRAEEIGDAVINHLASDPQLGGQVLLAQVTNTALASGLDEEGAISVHTITIAVKAHLS
jgi:hypothetical protein